MDGRSGVANSCCRCLCNREFGLYSYFAMDGRSGVANSCCRYRCNREFGLYSYFAIESLLQKHTVDN